MNQSRLALLASLALLSACSETPSADKLMADDYRQHHQLGVAPAVAQLRLASDQAALSGDDRRRLHDFAVQYVRKGHGTISVSTGGAGREDKTAQAYAQAIAIDLQIEGVKPRELSLWLVVGDPLTAPGQASLTFATSVADLPECNDWSNEGGQVSASNFGCAFQRNLGAMISDPRDLERQHGAMVADAARGDLIMDRVGRGEGSWTYPLPVTTFNPFDATKYGGK